MIENILKEHYGLTLLKAEKSRIGAGSDTWFVQCREGGYVLKFPSEGEINHPEREPELCQFLLERGIPACRFLKNRQGSFLSFDDSGRLFHLQRFFEGKVYDLNKAPSWLLCQSAGLLGKIHKALKGYEGLPEGIGPGFFQHMTPQRAAMSYERSLETAISRGEQQLAEELRYRLGLMERLSDWRFSLSGLTCQPSHGDYFISQLICQEETVRAVIDWTAACVHPVVWEIFRSYVYASPQCAQGGIDADGLSRYLEAYCRQTALIRQDIAMMARLFYYQIAVCDYYGQYYSSQAQNRQIYLHQARFSTQLMRWLEKEEPALTQTLLSRF